MPACPTPACSCRQAGQYQVLLNFTNAGAKQFDNIAAQRYPYYQQNPTNPPPCSLEAFELDGVVYSAPTIQAPSFNGTAVISGSTAQPFSSSQASNLSLVLKYGSLPVRFTPQSVQTVSATIGKDSLKAGLLAGLGGIIIVLLYMILYYRLLGLVVVVGLVVGGALLFSIITLLSQTTSLALTLVGRHGHHRLGRHHRRLLRGVLRAAQGRGSGRPEHPPVGRPQLRPGVPHRADRGLRRLPGRSHPVPVHGRRRAGLRLHARPVDPAGRLHGLLLHPARR